MPFTEHEVTHRIMDRTFVICVGSKCTIADHHAFTYFNLLPHQMDWRRVCAEFPAMHPAQLHFLLSHYLLPSSMDLVPTNWTPTKEDAMLALDNSEYYSLIPWLILQLATCTWP